MQSQIIKGAVQSRYPIIAGLDFKVEVFLIHYILSVKKQFNMFVFKASLLMENLN
jgi:hypothetical protein